MRVLVLYYSLDGNTRLMAQTIAKTCGADLQELRTEEEPKKGFAKYFWGGRQVFMKERPRLLPLEKKAVDYDLLFIGTPVWAFSPVPAVSGFLENAALSGKKIALFCCSGGGMGRTFQKMEALLGGNAIISTMHFVEPRRSEQASVKKAGEWAAKVLSQHNRNL
ncbi:MAG: flavodoxin [Candidatus Omnitrophota bacterium]